jgi:hypothetical protein
MALLHMQSGQSSMTKSRVVYGAHNFLDKPKTDKELCNLERVGVMLKIIYFYLDSLSFRTLSAPFDSDASSMLQVNTKPERSKFYMEM